MEDATSIMERPKRYISNFSLHPPKDISSPRLFATIIRVVQHNHFPHRALIKKNHYACSILIPRQVRHPQHTGASLEQYQRGPPIEAILRHANVIRFTQDITSGFWCREKLCLLRCNTRSNFIRTLFIRYNGLLVRCHPIHIRVTLFKILNCI